MNLSLAWWYVGVLWMSITTVGILSTYQLALIVADAWNDNPTSYIVVSVQMLSY